MPKQDLQALYSRNLTKVKACELALRRTRGFNPDARMRTINELLGGCGVEALRGEWSNGYWGDVVATYINFGDSYDTTIICLRTGGGGERLGIQ